MLKNSSYLPQYVLHRLPIRQRLHGIEMCMPIFNRVHKNGTHAGATIFPLGLCVNWSPRTPTVGTCARLHMRDLDVPATRTICYSSRSFAVAGPSTR